MAEASELESSLISEGTLSTVLSESEDPFYTGIDSDASTLEAASPATTKTPHRRATGVSSVRQEGRRRSRSRNDLEARRSALRSTLRAMKEAEQVDLCFLMDATGSMQRYLTSVLSSISDWSSQLHRNYEYMNLRLAMVCYTDYDQPESTRTRKLDFTSELSTFQAFVDSVETKDGVGGDGAEDVFGGLKVALQDLTWRSKGTKVLIHIADSPAHGERFHDGCVSDNHMEGDPAMIDEARLMLEVKKKNISYVFGYIRKRATDKMIQAFNDTLREMSNNMMMIEQFDARDKELLMDAVYTSIASSISTNVEVLQGRRTQELCEYSIDPVLPSTFDHLEQHEATIVTSTSPDVDSSAMALLQRALASTVVYTAKMIFQKCYKPFSQGKERLAYYAWDAEQDSTVVMKEFKRRGYSKDQYQEAIHLHEEAKAYAHAFEEQKPRGTPTIEFVSLTLVEMKPDLDGKRRYFTVERLIEGKYQKFNSNGGFAAMSPVYDAVQAFSHFSWCHSNGKLVICDIQGVKTDDGFLLTDPAIHHVDYRRSYGGTNLGRKGIKRFFKTHRCNDICKDMHLTPFSDSKDRNPIEKV